MAVHAQTAPIESLCVPKGFTVNFINGMYQTRTEAEGFLKEIKRTYKISGLTSTGGNDDKKFSYNNQPVDFELQYNRSEGAWKDLMEVFRQKSAELPDYKNRWENFWLGAQLSSSVSTAFIKLLPPAQKLLIESIRTSSIEFLKQKMEKDISKAVTYPNVQEIKRKLEDQMFEGKKSIIVAHSQGNLIMQQVWTALDPKYKNGALKIIHLGTPAASVINNSPYITTTSDVIINTLRTTLGTGSVLPGNSNQPSLDQGDEFLAHTWPYFYPRFTVSYAQVMAAYKQAFDSAKQADEIAPSGAFNIRLKWDGPGDIDLHVLEPSGKEVYYQAKQGNSGYLDTDNTYADGPEHYSATCDAKKLTPGLYKVSVKNYARGIGRKAFVLLNAPLTGKTFTENSNVTFSTEKQKTAVFNVLVQNEEITYNNQKKRFFDVSLQ